MNKIIFVFIVSVIITSCIATKGDNSAILIGKNRVVNLPTEYYDNSSKITIIYDSKNMAYIPKFELSPMSKILLTKVLGIIASNTIFLNLN